MKAKTITLACAAAVCGAAFADEEAESTGWAYNPGEGVSFDETPIVSGEASLAFDSKYLWYGLVENNDPILRPSGSLTFFDWVALSVEAYFDITKYGRRAGYTSRAWQYTELYPGIALEHSFSPDDYEWLPTTVDLAVRYQYEFHPNSKYKGGDGPDGQADDSQFWMFEIGFPDLCFEPTFYYERDVMRDNGTYLNLELGHTFNLLDEDDDTLTLRPSVAQGFGDLHLHFGLAGQVGQGDHAGELAVLHHGQAAHLLGGHALCRRVQRVLRVHGHQTAGHGLLHLQLRGVLLRGHAAQHDIPVGEHALELAVLAAHRQYAQVVPFHQAARHSHGLIRLHTDDVLCHHVLDLHRFPPFPGVL